MTEAFHEHLGQVTRHHTGALVDAIVEERRRGLAGPAEDNPWWHYAGPDCAEFVISTHWSADRVTISMVAGNGSGTGRMTPLCSAFETVCFRTGTTISFTDVTNTGMADILRQRGFMEMAADAPTMILPMPDLRAAYWHITHKDNAEVILREGFAGGWGDNGFGVYLFNNFEAAQDYRNRGGWQEDDPDNLVILEIVAPADSVVPIEIDPAWPNPEDYENVVLHPLEDVVDDDDRWRPAIWCDDLDVRAPACSDEPMPVFD